MKKTSVIINQSRVTGAWLLLGLILLALAPMVQAANLTWDTTIAADGVITDGAGTWTAGAGNWNNGSTSVGINYTSGDNVTFGSGAALAAAYTITLGGTPTTVGNMTFSYLGNSFGYTIGATANSQTLAFSGATITVSTTNNVLINPILSGNYTVTNTTATSGKGIVLQGNGAQTSANTITNCANTLLQAGNNSTTGSFGSANIVNYGTVTYRRAGSFTINPISGSGSVNYQLRGSTVSLNSAGTYSGATFFGYTGSGTAAAETFNWGVANALPSGTALTLSGTIAGWSMTVDLKGFNQTIGSLAGGGTISDTVFTSSSGAPTLTVSGTNAPTTYSGLLSGSLALTKGNTNKLTLNAVDTYTGNTTINGGTLALSASASINNSANIIITAGGTFDVSAISAYVLSTNLTASGTNTPATIIGNAAGSVSFGSQAITLNYDGTNPALSISNSPLVLNGNAFTVNKATPLSSGDYVIITNINNTISSNGTFTVNGSAISGSIASININGGEVILHLVPAPADPTKSTVTASPDSLPADNTATSIVTATIKDASNNPMAGVGVSWTVTGSGNTVTPASSGITDVNGQTIFTVKSVKPETKIVGVTVGLTTITNSLAITFTNPPTPLVLTWDPLHNTTASDGAGTWNTSTANWANNSTDVAWPNNGADSAVFGTGGAPGSDYMVTLATPVSVGNLTFANTANQYQLTGQIITLSNSPAINVAANGLISSPLTGSGFAKTGAGTLRIDGNATNFTDNITVSNGWLQIGNNGTAGSLGTGTITVMDGGTFSVRRTGTLNFSNTLAGTFTSALAFQLNGSAVVTLFKANTYTATNGTYLAPTASGTVGTLKLGINNALPATTDFSINQNGASRQTFDLAGYNQTLASLAGSGIATTAFITNSSVTASTLAVSGAATTTFNGTVAGNLNVEVDGSGSLTLSANNYSGNTTVKGGTLVLKQPTLSTNSTVTVTNGVLDLAFALNETNQVAALVLNGTNMAPGLYSATTESPYLAGTGSLLVVPVATINPNPPVLQVSYSAGTMSLAWPTNQGWILQSNSVSLTTPGAWFNYPADGSVTVTNVTITVDPTKSNVFYRMLKP